MERRRIRLTAWDGTVICRHCRRSVQLDRRRMAAVGDPVHSAGWTMECPSCHQSFRVRYGDRDLPQAQLSEAVAPSEAGVPRRRWWGGRRHTAHL